MAAGQPPRFRIFLWAATILFVVFIGIQFIRPELKNPPVTADVEAPPEVKQILKTSCYNCHSNETKLPWYDRIVPAYWLVTKDVRDGRSRLNFSEIGKLPAAQQKGALFESVNEIQLGAMPLPDYQRVHPESVITPGQLTILRQYLDPPTQSKIAEPKDISVADAQYDKWIQRSNAALDVRPAPNGIAFIPDYKNWKAISYSDRFDNHTTRQILGNDVAIQAIATNHINPWPDGTMFAKVAWLQQTDDKGIVHAGAFQQVEFMIRDSKKYASTKGWGWARWRGAELTPYGKSAEFTGECIGCHTPVRNNDYVFTMPIKGQQ